MAESRLTLLQHSSTPQNQEKEALGSLANALDSAIKHSQATSRPPTSTIKHIKHVKHCKLSSIDSGSALMTIWQKIENLRLVDIKPHKMNNASSRIRVQR